MKLKTELILLAGIIAFVFLIGGFFALKNKCEKRVEFYYNPACPHCQEVYPLVQSLEKQFSDWKFYYYDVSQTSYKDINGVPAIKIYTADGRNITLLGSVEIPKYLKCELQEMTTKECPTHLNLVRNSYFLE